LLIVDDERAVAESMAAIFRLNGHQPFFATSPGEGLEMARQVRPQLLITDVVMPRETGIQLAIKVVAEIPSCKVLLMSGQAETSNLLEDAEQQGYYFEILAKPVWPPDLIARAESMVADTGSDAASAT
jgi:DNA-binding NtrC family response regulator